MSSYSHREEELPDGRQGDESQPGEIALSSARPLMWRAKRKLSPRAIYARSQVRRCRGKRSRRIAHATGSTSAATFSGCLCSLRARRTTKSRRFDGMRMLYDRVGRVLRQVTTDQILKLIR